MDGSNTKRDKRELVCWYYWVWLHGCGGTLDNIWKMDNISIEEEKDTDLLSSQLTGVLLERTLVGF